MVLAITVVVGLISGSYPSLYLSSFMPVQVLKSNGNPHQGKGLMRKILVVFQFAVAGALIICTIIVSRQQNYIHNKDLGLNKENVMIIPMRDTAFINRQLQPFKNAIQENPAVLGVASSSFVPPMMASKVVFQVEKEEGMVELAVSFSIVDHEFIDVMGINLLQGRNFDRERPADLTGAFIVNEEAVKAFGWGDNPLGKKVRFGINRIPARQPVTGKS
jgi:putative ABC transport system permease protein